MGFGRKRGASCKQTKRAAHAGVRLAKLSNGGHDRSDSEADAHGENAETDSTPASSPSRAGTSMEPNATVAELVPKYAYDEIPDEVLVGVEVDLSMWSVVAHDSCLQRLGGRKRQRAKGRSGLGSHSNQLAETLVVAASGSRPPPTPAAIQRLNLRGADQITDRALRTIAELCPNLTNLNIDRAAKLTDVGLRHLVSTCRRLQAIHLSYIPSLRGIALSAIADCHLQLRELSLAGCPHVPDFALQRVLQACGTTLERLDLSYSDDSVTDNTLLSVGQYCVSGRLQSIRLRGCRQVSDAGIVHLMAACANLSVLDLTRFDLSYKLNDIALLSLAEKCVLLQTVQLSGCDSLTDVGISWLTSGCQGITHLDVSGSTKLTDIAMRAVGENLLRLRHLSVKNCARISDLGLRHLAIGCPELSHLDVSGLILLSDPQVSSVLIGIAAVVSHCRELHDLDLSRCASIGDGTLLALASRPNVVSQLATLNLAGCPRVTSRGVQEILLKCNNQLTTLSLQGCARTSDHAFESFRGSAPRHALPLLAVLRLRHCELITDASIRAITQANAPLKELDVTGCVRLTDMAVLALTQSPTSSSTLRFLWLRDVAEITETALSWLAECCPKLLFLDLNGCTKIRAFSLQALASNWKFAVYTRHFKGLKPIYRAEDRLFIEEYGDCWRAAVRIQSLFRARVARRIAAQRREEQLQVWVATRLQSVYRGRQARRIAIVRRLQFNKETEAARRIQARYRQRLARVEATRQRAQRYAEQREAAARCVQLAWRRKRLRERLNVREVGRLHEKQRVEQAATKLQRLWRGKHARDRVCVLRAAKLLREREENEAANKMQNVFRMRAARREANAKREQKRQLERQQEQAALLLQRHVRRHHAQREMMRRRRADQRVQDAATRIQRKWRANKRNFALQLVAFSKQQKREHDAAVKLQASWKRKKGRDAMRLLKWVKQAHAQRDVDAAVVIQTAWRNKIARRAAMQAKHAALDAILQELRLHNRCAALIQSHFRGRRGREQYRALVLERKKQRWKEILHPDTGKPFYYNKDTGEVRFRRPQDVLDLLPKPLCDNCVAPEISIAHVECQDCGELYCNTCWHNVHAGGRRKGHAFRVLYDYYDRRVDYGDGEFPSRWPSEIHQDEMDGWSLRTYPRRTPVETRGAWEKYEGDAARSGGHAWWYYNKETEANSYTAPPQWGREGEGSTDPQYTVEVASDASGWAKYVDAASGYAYYYHAATGESTYERPLSFLTPREGDPYVERSADGWTKFVDASTGAAYYYNAVTGESTYARPVSFLTPRRGQAPVETPTSGSDGWSKYYDDAQGVYYYYNAWTRTSAYERPAQFQTPRVVVSEVDAAMQQHVFVDAGSQRKYAYDAQTTECRAVVTSTTTSGATRDARVAGVQRGYR